MKIGENVCQHYVILLCIYYVQYKGTILKLAYHESPVNCNIAFGMTRTTRHGHDSAS